jgi:hypothetical protein
MSYALFRMENSFRMNGYSAYTVTLKPERLAKQMQFLLFAFTHKNWFASLFESVCANCEGASFIVALLHNLFDAILKFGGVFPFSQIKSLQTNLWRLDTKKLYKRRILMNND